MKAPTSWNFHILRSAVLLVALVWTSVAFCGEIHEAAKNGDLEKIKSLLAAMPTLLSSIDDNGETPLHCAAYQGHKDVAQLLLNDKADVNAKDSRGATPLHYAAIGGYKDVAELLLANKADVNAKANDGQTPLHLAALGGQKEMAEFLLANKADVNAKDNNGTIPLHGAVYVGNKALAACRT